MLYPSIRYKFILGPRNRKIVAQQLAKNYVNTSNTTCLLVNQPNIGHGMAMAMAMPSAYLYSTSLHYSSGNHDIDFLLVMIPHHEAAVRMCDIYYTYWPCARTGVREVCAGEVLALDEIQQRIHDGHGDEVTIALLSI